ncbi:MAG: DMT family transporter [Lachnospiraceae bacterium]|nr:DMT family transporter [Lachnospiraceae bacterium]
MSNKTKGILCIMLSSFSWAVMGILVRLAGDVPSFQKSVFRNLVAMMAAGIFLLASRMKIKLKKGDMKWLILRSAAGTIGLLGNFYALDRMMVADANMLNKLAPFFTVIVSVFLLKEALRVPQILCIATAFIGTLFVIKPGMTGMPMGPAMVAVLGGAGAGTAYSIVRLLQKRGIPGPFIVFFFSMFSCVVVLPWVIPHYQPMEGKQLACLLLAGCFASVGQFAVTAAYRFAPAREISIYDYSQIIFSTLLGILFLNQIPDGWSFLGYTIIIAASVAMFLYNGRREKTVRQNTETQE